MDMVGVGRTSDASVSLEDESFGGVGAVAAWALLLGSVELIGRAVAL